MFKRTGWGFTITALIVALAIWALAQMEFQLGIDLNGGTELTYELDLSEVEYDVGGANIAEVVKDMVAQRLDTYGLKEINISVLGSDRLIVQLPGAAESAEVERIKRQIENTGQLDFMLVLPEEERAGAAGRLLDAVRQHNQAVLDYNQRRVASPNDPTLGPPPARPEALTRLEEEHRDYKDARVEFERSFAAATTAAEKSALEPPKAPEFIVLPRAESVVTESGARRFESKPGSLTVLRFAEEYRVSGNRLKYANVIRDERGSPAIGFGFDPQGATKFSEITGNNIDKQLAIVLDGRLLQSPNIQSRISDRGQITGDFSYDEVQGVVNILRGGSLPTKPKLISQSTVGSQFGEASIQSGITAVASGLLVILAFMLVYYMVGGFVANIALVLNIILILGYVLTFRQTLTFPGIAGILLTIGMSVDANILIFERVREEISKGKSLVAALATGYQRAFWVIFDSNLTTFITGVVLLNFGTGPIKGFAVTLIAGILASFFTAVFVTRLLLSFMLNVGLIRGFPMLRIIGVPRVDFQSYRKPFLVLSVVAIVLTWGIFVIPRGSANYGIDFTGGTKVTMNLAKPLAKRELDGMIRGLSGDKAYLFHDFSLQTINADEGGLARSFTILTRESAVESNGDETVAEGQEADGASEGEAGAAAEGDGAADGLSSESAVRVVLEELLAAKDPALLLPPPFPRVDESTPNPTWVDTPERAGIPVVSGVQGMELRVNLRYVDPALTDERLREFLDAHLEQAFSSVAHPEATDDGVFKGLRVLELRLEDRSTVPGTDATVSRYVVKTTGYRAPVDAVAEASDVPSQQDVEGVVKRFFRGNSDVLRDAFPSRRVLEISEPFPEIVTIGPRVATNLQRQAVIALFIAMVAIIFYLSLRFEFTFGLAAIAALLHDVLVALGIMAMTDALFGDVFSLKINLPEVAAFLTIIGYSVNDTIVVFDRIRENLRAGKKKISFEDLVNASINQTLARTIWTSGTTLVVVSALLIFGGEPVKGFAFAFSIGLVAGTYSSVFVASPALLFLRRKALERRERVRAEAQLA